MLREQLMCTLVNSARVQAWRVRNAHLWENFSAGEFLVWNECSIQKHTACFTCQKQPHRITQVPNRTIKLTLSSAELKTALIRAGWRGSANDVAEDILITWQFNLPRRNRVFPRFRIESHGTLVTPS